MTWIMGFPPMGSSTLRGNRVDPMRAGMMAMVLSFFDGTGVTRSFYYLHLPGTQNGFLLPTMPYDTRMMKSRLTEAVEAPR